MAQVEGSGTAETSVKRDEGYVAALYRQSKAFLQNNLEGNQ